MKNFENAVKEVQAYSNKPITTTSIPFPKNHLYCVRGKYCDFAEHQDTIKMYVHIMSMRIIVIIDGGCVSEIVHNIAGLDVEILDRDTDGADDKDLGMVDGSISYIYTADVSENDPERVESITKELSERREGN